MKKSRAIACILTVLASIVVSLLVVEYVFRKTTVVDKIIDPERGDFVTNSQGFRAKEKNIVYGKDPGENFRIICLGDSFTFGYGLTGGNAYPAFLEEYLRGNYKDKIQRFFLTSLFYITLH